MTALVPMKEEEFNRIMQGEQEHYASEKVKVGTWTEEEARDKSKETFEQLLPNGLHTANHHFLSIQKNEENIGYFWYHFDLEHKQREAFIYNFLIFEHNQGQGLGKSALQELEVYVRDQGVKKLSLHVFGHNQRAINLYNQLKFETTDLHMSKYL